MSKQFVKQGAARKEDSSHSTPLALTQPHRSLTSAILMLQRTIGNQAVLRIPHEQERHADANSPVQKLLGFKHGFSRIPSHSLPNSASVNPTINEPGIGEQELMMQRSDFLQETESISSTGCHPKTDPSAVRYQNGAEEYSRF